MELVKTEDITKPVGSLAKLPMLRQLGVMFGLAVSVALAVTVALWSQSPDYGLLYPNLPEKDTGEVMDALETTGIDYKVDKKSGVLMVPGDQVHEARIKLATIGLPKSAGTGFELLDQEQGFGTSRFMERARYQRALEGELVRSIVALNAVRNARIHLAVPKQSVFVRNRKAPSASVVVELYAGRVLEKGQVEAIVHIVASSVPELEPSRVAVIDQNGRVLSRGDRNNEMGLTTRQFEYTQQLEERYAGRIEDILMPITGTDRVRARVTAEVDFTMTEQTRESFNPDLPAMRSEQISEEQSRLLGPQGIPGALSNQPPGAGEAPEVANGEGRRTVGSPLNTSKRATRNFELDKMISHSRLSAGGLRRLSVAVVVDDHISVDEAGKTVHTPLTGEELDRITGLVKQAIGFNAQRGDSVNVINASFQRPGAPEPLPEPPLWEQSWVWSLAKQVLAGLLVLILVFGVLRPTMRALVLRGKSEREAQAGTGEAQGDSGVAREQGANPQLAGADGQLSLSSEDLAMLEGPARYEQRLEIARKMAKGDPKRVAQLVKNWIAEDE